MREHRATARGGWELRAEHGVDIAKVAFFRYQRYKSEVNRSRKPRLYPPVPERIGEWPAEALVAETSARAAAPKERIRLALQAARHLTEEDLEVVRGLMALRTSGITPQRRRAVSRGLSRTLSAIATAAPRDPLAVVDEPLNAADGAAAVLEAELEAQERRETLLQDCIGAANAARLTGRSRQSLERLRRSRRALALRVRNQWRYPAWQFDPDALGGVVRGLAEVLARLPLSPAGAALWLTRRMDELDGRSPIEELRRDHLDAVVRLADEQASLP